MNIEPTDSDQAVLDDIDTLVDSPEAQVELEQFDEQFAHA